MTSSAPPSPSLERAPPAFSCRTPRGEGIESVVIDSRTREEIEQTIRAGILEHGTVRLLAESGASERVLRDGQPHDGIELRFAGEGHRIDFPGHTGRSVWLYPQHEVLKDLIATRLAAGQDLRFAHTALEVRGRTHGSRATASRGEGDEFEIVADVVVGPTGRAASPGAP